MILRGGGCGLSRAGAVYSDLFSGFLVDWVTFWCVANEIIKHRVDVVRGAWWDTTLSTGCATAVALPIPNVGITITIGVVVKVPCDWTSWCDVTSWAGAGGSVVWFVHGGVDGKGQVLWHLCSILEPHFCSIVDDDHLSCSLGQSRLSGVAGCLGVGCRGRRHQDSTHGHNQHHNLLQARRECQSKLL